jgi:hypothetical protein
VPQSFTSVDAVTGREALFRPSTWSLPPSPQKKEKEKNSRNRFSRTLAKERSRWCQGDKMEAGKTKGVLAACLAVVFLVFFFEYLVAGVAGAPREAYVTFVASDEYAVGARALGASLRATGSPSLSISPLSLLTPPSPFSVFVLWQKERRKS